MPRQSAFLIKRIPRKVNLFLAKFQGLNKYKSYSPE